MAKRFAPGQQHPQNEVGQVGLFGHEPAELWSFDPEDDTGLTHSCGRDSRLAGDEVELAEEVARTPADDGRLRRTGHRRPDDLDLAGFDGDEVIVRIARTVENVAGRDR